MSVSTGTRLGAYEILAPLGAGGMGEVYRARDTKLNRDVAIKVLPEAYRVDSDRIARLRREAQLLASLNHPNIAAIYDLEPSTGALVLELVEGPTLADRLDAGPIPVDEALGIARQIASALEAAHDHDVIHRDLKPANIKLRADGTVKVLDFGLAKWVDPMRSHELTESPTTLSPAPTMEGIILGTAAYMSPEQARGKVVDKRSDIWAFGCVLYEMLTGHRPFDGETLTDVAAAILKNEPNWMALPPDTPARVQSLIARCLKKDPAQRCRDVADVRFQIEDAKPDRGGSEAVVTRRRNYREWTGWIAAVLCLAAVLFLVVKPSTTSVGDAVSFPVFPPEKTVFSAAFNRTINVPSFALSPDGHALVFAAETPGGRPMLWVRSLDRLDARQLAGTEGAQNPMWSPDSRWIGFVVDQKLKKVNAAGGTVQEIAQSSADFYGSTFITDDTILFSSGSGQILRVDAAGGATAPVTTIDATRRELMHRNPDALPDGHHFVYFVGGGQDGNGVYAGALDQKTKKLLVRSNASAVYAPPGYLLRVDGDNLMAQRLDTERLEILGQPLPVAEHVGRSTAFASAVSASRTGTIAYAGLLDQKGRLTWMDRAGHPLGEPVMREGDNADFRLSHDGTRLAVSSVDRDTNALDIWVMDLARGSSSRVASGGPVNASPIWSPDDTHLIFRTNRDGVVEFYERSAAGGGNDRRILDSDAARASLIPGNNLVLTDWSPDGEQIMFSVPAPASGTDLWLLPLTGDRPRAARFIASPGHDMHGNFSPKGHLMAYTSNESGKFEVYAETIPRSDRKWSVSTNGGSEPRWRGDGRELYYLSEDRTLMAVAVGDGPTFGVPKPLFQTRVAAGVTANRTHYVPSSDGQRFLVNVASDAVTSPITVVLNWTSLLPK